MLHAVALPAVPENLIGQQMLRNRITQFPMRWQKALLSYDKAYKNAFQLPNHSNNLENVEAKGIKIKIKTKPASEPAVRGMQAVASA